MGNGRWDASIYRGRRERPEEKAAGTSFMYSTNMASSMPPTDWKAHETLDPTAVAGAASPFAGSVMREARDNDEHPETTPIAVFFDVTGSMRAVPQILQAKLPGLYTLLLSKGYVEHPQILFGAIGDASADRVPLQVGQFESDNRADENLENLFLEGGGGGGNHESYELAAYFVARHTATDAWDKRGKRGYLFFIGDERTYARVNRAQVERIIGDALQEDVPTKSIFADVLERWDTYYLFAQESGSYTVGSVIDPAATTGDALAWRDLLGQNALVLEDASAVCETIALTVGIAEGIVDLDAGLADLADAGSDAKAIEATGRALATVGAGVATSSGDASGDLDLDLDDGDGAARL